MDPIALVVEVVSFAAVARMMGLAPEPVVAAYDGLRRELARRGIGIPALDGVPDPDRLRAALEALRGTDREVDMDLLRTAGEVADALVIADPFRNSREAAELRGLHAALRTAVVGQYGRGWSEDLTRGGIDIPPRSIEDWGIRSSPPEAPAVDDWGRADGGAGPWLLGDDPPPDDRVLPRPTGAPPLDDTSARWFTAEVEDMLPTGVLQLGRTVTLAFDVDVRVRRSALGVSPLADIPFAPGVDEVELTIQLDSDDFDIGDHARPLRLPRTGPSRGRARFDITPRQEGRCFLTAVVHREGNFVQKLDLALSVGTAAMAPSVTGSGRPLAVESLPARDLTLIIEPDPGAGYRCTVIKAAGAYQAALPITKDDLADAVETARASLMAVIGTTDAAGTLVFQTGIDIPDPQCEGALRTLARTGARLFNRLFAPADPGGKNLARLAADVREVLQPGTQLKVQVVARGFALPWGLLYLGDASRSATLSWACFLGLRTVVELLPLQIDMAEPSQVIASDQPALAVCTVMNTAIDTDMRIDAVARQEAFWTGLSTVLRRTRHDRTGELLDALTSTDHVDVLYFYCHATASDIDRPGGLDAAMLGLVDARLTLADLSLDAPLEKRFVGSPLVFVNACESAEMSPLFYDGFVPYFVGKGARGVIGTECKTPALLAAAWAQRFFERFLGGEALGDAVLALRREFLEERGNPLGLVYCVHCDADVRVLPALATT